MHTLGINAAFHDCSAVLVSDGVVIAAAEEERFSRIKHGKRPVPFSTWQLPFNAIDYCLREAGIDLVDVDHVAYAFDPWLQLRAQGIEPDAAELRLPLQPSAQSSSWQAAWDPLFLSSVVNAPRQLASGAPLHLAARFRGARHDGPYRWHFIDHHLAHEASACLAAPFDDCAVLTMDGRGESATTSYGVYRHGAYRRIRQVGLPHSIGLLYEQVTSYLGFLHASDEYKVMALASFGKPLHAATFREILRYQGGGDYRIVQLDYRQLFGPARAPGAPLTQQHHDIARSLQQVLQETVLQMAQWLQRDTGAANLALAGGVALNCVLNAVLRAQAGFEAVWVQPAAGDAGTALGAALWVDGRERLRDRGAANDEDSHCNGHRAGCSAGHVSGHIVGDIAGHNGVQIAGHAPEQHAGDDIDQADNRNTSAAAVALAPRRWQMQHAYLGPGYDDDTIEAALRYAGLAWRRMDDIADAVADLLAEGRIVGWFQGRMEFGPRALGARSILASPLDAGMQSRLNRLKDREDFRPVAPVVLEHAAGDWFARHAPMPFMTFVADVLERQADRIPAVRHVDGTARVQTVNRGQHPLLCDLLEAFAARTGVPVLVNTSFNTRGEPIVCTPRDAIESFCSTPLDALAIGPFLLGKQALHG